MEGILCDQCYFEVIKNEFLSDQDVQEILKSISIGNGAYFRREGEIRYLQYTFNGQKFINLQDLIFLMNKKCITITFQQTSQIIVSILQTVLYYQKLYFNLEKIKANKIWIHCESSFSSKKVNQNSFKILITDVLNFYKGVEVPISNNLLSKMKEIILIFYYPFIIFDQPTWINIIKQQKSINLIIDQIKNTSPKLIHYLPINQIYQPQHYGLILKWNSLKELQVIFPQLFSSLIKHNIVHWIIKGDIFLKQDQQENLQSFLSALQLEKLRLIQNCWMNEENAKKLKLYLIENEFLNSLENLQKFPNEEFQQLTKCLIISQQTYQTELQRNQIVNQMEEVFQKFFPRFLSILVSKTQLSDLIRLKNILEKYIPEIKSNITQFNQEVFKRINEAFKLQSIKNVDELEIELSIEVFQQIDYNLLQYNSIDQISQILSDENIVLNVVKDFYTQKVKELNKKTVEKIKFDKE